MLPAWATVVIALGGSALGALAGVLGSYVSLRAAHLNVQHAKEEDWRSRMVEAAEAFAKAWGDAAAILAQRTLSLPKDDASLVLVGNEIEGAALTANADLIRLWLVFGPDSTAGQLAQEALVEVTEAAWVLTGRISPKADEGSGSSDRLSLARGRLVEADAKHDEFLRAAFAAASVALGKK